MASLPAPRPATYDDLAAVPDHQVAELLDSELVVSPRPAAPHARAASRLGALLVTAFDLGVGGPGGWQILDAPELHLGRDVVVPDLAGWRTTRMPAPLAVAAFELAPDWVCEVLSPRTERVDRTSKMRLYRREGVGHLWLLDPDAQTLEVYRCEGHRWVHLDTHGGDETVHAEPFEALALDLTTLWTRT